MADSVYNESFLPLRFFLHTVIVYCPSCNKKAVISTDMPPVEKQEKIKTVFNDLGTISCSPNYIWNKARFLCHICQKHFDTDMNHILQTWHGPVIGIANIFCLACKEMGFKEMLSAKRKYISKNNIPEQVELSCPKCQTSTMVKWHIHPFQSSSVAIDPIFGLKLFAVTRIKNEVLWVYNLEHLHHIKAYIQAKQRKISFNIEYSSRSTKISRKEVISFSQQLPQVFKNEQNRTTVLKTLAKLYNQVELI